MSINLGPARSALLSLGTAAAASGAFALTMMLGTGAASAQPLHSIDSHGPQQIIVVQPRAPHAFPPPRRIVVALPVAIAYGFPHDYRVEDRRAPFGSWHDAGTFGSRREADRVAARLRYDGFEARVLTI